MADMSHDPLWPELRRRGLIGAATPQPLGAGNRDRRADHTRTLYRLALPDGRPAKLTVGRDLSSLCARAHDWRDACPTLAGQSLFRLQLGEHDLFAEEFFEGISLETAVLQRTLPFAQIHRAFLAVTTALRNTRQPSTDALRLSEWETWSAEVLALAHWSASDLAFLHAHLLPSLAGQLLAGPSIRQWVHGDLTDTNLLLGATGQPRLIDPEFAAATHFFAAEAARFYALSKSAAAQPGLFAAIFPEPAAAAQIHFWLTQLQREATHNEPAYLARWLSHRLATIRRLTASLSPSAFAACPWPDSPDARAPCRDTAQLFWSVDTGWAEPQSTRIAFNPDRPQSLFFPVADRPQPWRLDPAASPAPTLVRHLTGYSAAHETVAEFGPTWLHALSKLPLEDSSLTCVPGGLLVASPRGDPQFAFSLALSAAEAPIAWLEVEIERAAPPAFTFRLEESRWTDQPASTALRLAGWCLAPAGTTFTSISARVGDNIVATSGLLARPDVQLAFPADVGALHSGFALDLPPVDALAFVELVAMTSTGATLPFYAVQAGDLPHRVPILGDYPVWAARHDPDPPAPVASPSSPDSASVRFSVLLPTYNPPEDFLHACIASVRAQHHTAWELCVVDDGSAAAWIAPYLTAAAQADPRIRFQRRASNGGIARATNDALAMATGEFVVFLDHDDLLRPHALAEFARKLAAEPSLDALYSDEDKISADGRRLTPFFKPDFSPEFLLGVMYIGHALAVRTSVARATGGFDPAFDGVQDYEFFLRVTERTRRIGHIARILYHWRQSPSSSALHGNVKGDMDARQAAAVAAHLRRRIESREARILGRHRVRVSPSALVPLRVALVLAWPADAIDQKCPWARLVGRAHAIYLSPDQASRHLPRLPDATPLTSATLLELLREAAALTAAEVLVLLTAAPLAVSDDWLDEVAATAALSDSGCVAPLILAQEGHVLESGRLLDGRAARPLMRGFDPRGDGCNGTLRCTREVAAVSACCVAVRRELLSTRACGTLPADWWMFTAALRRRALFHRTCASASVQVALSWRSPATATVGATEAVDGFFNPHFNPFSANYSLATPPRHLSPAADGFLWFVDTPPPARLTDGCLTLRGWCFRPDRKSVIVRVSVAGLTWSTGCSQPRPDVAAQHAGLTDEACGFTIHLRLAPGRHTLGLVASAENAVSEDLLRQPLTVSAFAGFRRWLHPEKNHCGAFQMMATPSCRPRAIQPEIFPRPPPLSAPAPRFTVVTPSFQHARFLEETMLSVLDQPGVDCDYLVQDGGSTDGTTDLLRRHSARLFAAESVRDRGQSDAIVRGFAKSTSAPTDLMAWLNSDDFYVPGALAFVAHYFARHPEVDVLYGNRIVVDEASREVGRWFLPRHDPLVLRLNDYVPQETLFWRRRVWDAVGGLDASLQFALDWDLLLRFDRAGAKIVHVPYFLACFRIHAGQKTSAAIHQIGHTEINRLRQRTFGRVLTPQEIENHPRLRRYVRRSAVLEFLGRRCGLRAS